MDAAGLTSLTKSESFCEFLGTRPGDDVAFELMGHGEYNLNYLLRRPSTGEKLVLRIPMGSQMHLSNQIRYEFEALRLLEPTGRTPKPYYIDDTQTVIPHGFLVMSFLPGRALRYESDLEHAARCLADIHNLEVSDSNHLLAPESSLSAILEECSAMLNRYQSSDMASLETVSLISSLFGRGRKILENAKPEGARCLINTELNSGNFLVGDNGSTYLVDWEKPLYACLAQDLGHFLAPTTTFWKTGSILSESEIEGFLRCYCNYSARYSDASELLGQTMPFLAMNCLRGVTWCAMAFVEYQSPGRALKDAFTFEKIKTYISAEFLQLIGREYLKF